MDARLHAELNRLYLPPSAPEAHGGLVRGLVLELTGSSRWQELSTVWRHAQAALGLPAPGIAISGQGLQLWFSLRQPVDADRGMAFLHALRQQCLPALAASRYALQVCPPAALPPANVGDERWSAFVAADLAPLFDAEPWLDHPPGADAQADILSRLEPTAADAFEDAFALLHTATAAPPLPGEPRAAALDARTFLQQVMNDASVPMQHRIEAAKALLQAPKQP